MRKRYARSRDPDSGERNQMEEALRGGEALIRPSSLTCIGDREA